MSDAKKFVSYARLVFSLLALQVVEASAQSAEIPTGERLLACPGRLRMPMQSTSRKHR